MEAKIVAAGIAMEVCEFIVARLSLLDAGCVLLKEAVDLNMSGKTNFHSA